MLAGLQFPVFTTASKHQSVAGLTWGRGKVSEVRLRGWAEVEGLLLPVWPIVCARASSSGLLPLKQRATHVLCSCFCLLYNTEQWAKTLWPPPPKIAWSRLFKGKLDFAFLFPALGLKFCAKQRVTKNLLLSLWLKPLHIICYQRLQSWEKEKL